MGSVDSTMVFTGFTVQNGSLGGIGCGQGASPIISYNTVRNNHGTSNNAGIACSGAGIPIIRYNKIVENINGTMSSDNGGGIACVLGGSPIIYKNTIKNNFANNGGGIYCDNASPVITYNTISGDSAYLGGGIYCDNNSNPEIRYNLICDNQAISTGGGIYSTNSQPLIENNTICGNNSFFWGSAMYAEISLPTISNNIFAYNTGSAAVVTGAALNYCDFYNNSNGHFSATPPGTGVITTINHNGDSCDVYFNIFMDPLFADTANADFQLTENSPCIDAGDPASAQDPDGTITDMGRYFFDQGGTGIPGGYVSGNWTVAGSPYRLLGAITIHADSTLTIEPGVEVIFQGLYSFQVNGALAAIGTEIDSISFSAADTSVGWRGIRLDAAADNSSITYASIRYGRNTDGGGIYCASPNAVITHCAITENKASNNGGGICINNGFLNPPPVFNSCVISRNSARFGGGVFYVADSMVISDCVISYNSAQHPSGLANGGGIYFSGGFLSSININNCTIQNNYCESDSGSGANSYSGLGGGIYINGRNNGGTFISNCQILSNWSRRAGGGIFVDLGGVVISNSTIKGNFTKHCAPRLNVLLGGGAIGLSNLNINSIISGCEISENSGMGYSGGAIRAYHNVNASLTLENCTISRNNSFIGVGVVYIVGHLMVKNSVFAFNRSNYHVGGLDANSINVSYSDFLSNDGPDISSGAPGGFGTLTATNANGDSCDIYSNIFLDPLFADTSINDFHLTENSPCIDAGDPASSLDPDSTITDMGAYYFDQLFPIIYVNQDSLEFGNVEIGAQKDTTFKIFNQGSDSLIINQIISGSAVFTTNFNPGNNFILPNDSMLITVTFTPTDSGFVDDTLIIDNNAQLIDIYLSGFGKTPVSIIDELSNIPKEYALHAAYPNPFNPTTTIKLDIPKLSFMELKVFDILGKQVKTVISENKSAGSYKYVLNGSNLASGLYFIKMQAGDFRALQKILLVK